MVHEENFAVGKEGHQGKNEQRADARNYLITSNVKNCKERQSHTHDMHDECRAWHAWYMM
jgi:hypothetical protein